jgi:hypothetical protein
MSAAPIGFGGAASAASASQQEKGLLSQVTGYITSAAATSQNLLTSSSPVLYVLYAAILGIVISVILLVVDVYFPFLPINPIAGPSAAARAGKRFWTRLGDDAENLVVPPTESPTTLPDQYTMSVQLVLADSRTPDIGRFRHVLHRGANPCGFTATKSGSTGHAGVKATDLPPGGDPSYLASGLPPIMNPGLMLDNYKNDLHVFIHTRGYEGGEYVMWLESLTIEDLPLNTPTTVGVVCNGQALEVYVNCRLYGTLLLRGQPYLPAADNAWYGRYCAYAFSGLIKNLQLWGTALSTSDYTAMCEGASFKSDKLPSTCPTAGSRSGTPDSVFGTIGTIMSGKQLSSTQSEGLAQNLVVNTLKMI